MLDATFETLYMSCVSLVISWIIAMPIGSMVSETRPGGLFPNKVANFLLNRIIDVGRSIPFILLAVFMFPVTRALIGTAIGMTAMIVPLTICAIPFEARLIEEILSEIPGYVIKAAKIDGASNLKIIVRIKWACKLPYLVNAIGITLINIIGYSAMAAVVVGNPTVIKKYRFDKETIVLLLELKWWDKDIEEIKKLIPLLTGDIQQSKKELKKLLKK